MNPKFNTRDPQIVASLPALKRASKKAFALASNTDTPFYVLKEGRVVNLNPSSKSRRRPKNAIRADAE